MNKKHLLPLASLLTLLLLSSCKTAEDIRRERIVDDMANKMVSSEKSLNQSQQFTGDLALKLRKMEENINKLNGQIEELEHGNKSSSSSVDQQMQVLQEKIQHLEKDLKDQQKDYKELSGRFEKERKYIQEVLSTLKKLQGRTTSVPSPAKTLTPKEKYAQAIALYQKKKFKEAKPLLIELSEDKKLDTNSANHVRHNLGVMAFMDNEYEKTIIYMSKIYSQTPKSSYAANALFHIGKSLQKMNKKDEAKEAFKEVIIKYPQSQTKILAQNELKQIK